MRSQSDDLATLGPRALPLTASTVTDGGRTSRLGVWCRAHDAELAFGALLALGSLIVLLQTRGVSFYFDDWDFVLNRRGLGPDVLLRGHGPHLSLIPILIYKAVLATFGGTSYLPFRLLAAADIALVGLVLGLVCRRLWGRWWGLAPVLLLVTLGSGGWTLLFPFQVGYAIADAAGLIALLLLSRDRPRDDAIASLALIVSLASASQGIAFLAGAGVLVAVQGNWRRRAWPLLVPGALYALWYAKYGHSTSETYFSLWRESLPYMMKALSTSFAGLLGLGSPTADVPPLLDPSFGQPLAVAAVILLLAMAARGWRPSPLFWSALATLIVLWLAASLSNISMNRRPTDSRYLSTEVMLLMTCAFAALPRPKLRGRALLVPLTALAIVSLANAGQFTEVGRQMRATSVASRAQLGALMIMRGIVPPQFMPATPFSTGLLNGVEAGSFYRAVDSFGLIYDSPAVILRQSEGTRELADQVLERGEMPGISYGRWGSSAGARCRSLAQRQLVLQLNPGSYRLAVAPHASLSVRLARFASSFDIPAGSVRGGAHAALRLPADHAAVPWRVLLNGSGRLCY